MNKPKFTKSMDGVSRCDVVAKIRIDQSQWDALRAMWSRECAPDEEDAERAWNHYLSDLFRDGVYAVLNATEQQDEPQ